MSSSIRALHSSPGIVGVVLGSMLGREKASFAMLKDCKAETSRYPQLSVERSAGSKRK